MDFIIGLLIGGTFGVMTMAIMTVSGDCSKIEEAYYKGFEDGKATNNN